MTDDAVKIAIAEACGWKKHEHAEVWKNPKANCHEHVEGLPDPDDLNVMHKAEKTLNQAQTIEYIEILGIVTRPHDTIHDDLNWARTMRLVHANGTNRKEAFLRTIDKWAE